MESQNRNNRVVEFIKKIWNCGYIVVLYFITYFVVGLQVVGDYGLSSDEESQRVHSLVAYRYISEKIFHRYRWIYEFIPNFDEYKSKYYGTAIQLPMVLIEDIFDFQMPANQIYYIRHVMTFFWVFVGYVFFYFSLRRIIGKNNWFVAFIGTVMISLYPRFFAYQFVDIKNLVFASLNMVSFYYLIRAVEDTNARNCIAFGLVTACATNQRIMAVIFPVVLIGYYVLKDCFCAVQLHKFNIVDLFPKYIEVIASYSLFWILISPFAWSEPIKGFVSTFRTFSYYSLWDGTMVFMGRLISCDEQPWYYLFVWFGISIPLSYLVAFVFETILYGYRFINSKEKLTFIIDNCRWQSCALLLFFGEVLGVIIIKSRIYLGWHHMFFAFVPFCIIATYGVLELKNMFGSKIVYSVMVCSLICTSSWIIQNHPYEGVYLNLIGRQYGELFDREEWQLGSYQAIKWLLAKEQGDITVAGACKSVSMLSNEERLRMKVYAENPQYYISCYRNIVGNDLRYDGYEEVYTVKVDGYKVCSIFKRID